MNELQWYGGSVLVDSTERSAYYVRDRRWVGFDIEESMWSKIQVGKRVSAHSLYLLQMPVLSAEVGALASVTLDRRTLNCCICRTLRDPVPFHYVACAGCTAVRCCWRHDLGRLPGRAGGHPAAGGGLTRAAARAALRWGLHWQRAVRQHQRMLLRGGCWVPVPVPHTVPFRRLYGMQQIKWRLVVVLLGLARVACTLP